MKATAIAAARVQVAIIERHGGLVPDWLRELAEALLSEADQSIRDIV